jgi:two-component system sensor histidine kinase ChvG
MALDTERSPEAANMDGREMGRLSAFLRSITNSAPSNDKLREWIRSLAISRFLSASLHRRILAANVLGLAIMIVGFHIFWPEQVWVIDAKRDALRTQSEIIATAIARNATVDEEGVSIETDTLTNRDQARVPFRDDAFAAFELSISPQRVAPILRQLIQPTKTRARIYAKDGTLIVDSTTLLARGQITRPVPPSTKGGVRPKTKNFWTKLTAWLIDKELPVYTEIGSANGNAYPEVRTALTGKLSELMLLTDKGEQIVSVAAPIKRRNAVQGVLLLSSQPGEIEKRIWEGRQVLWTLALTALLASLITSALLARTVSRPMRRLSEAAEHVSRNITARQDLPDFGDRNDEVGQMASAFKAMTAALYRRIEASENFAADVAHELKNPLAAARSTAEGLSYAKTDSQRAELIHQIQGELKRLNRLISDVSNASRLDAELARQKSHPVEVTQIVESINLIFKDILSEDTRRVRHVIEAPPFEGAYVVSGDDGRLGQVLTNLVDNAISFSPENGTVTIRTRRHENYVELAVEDEGLGIPEDRQKIIFDRFYTDRPQTDALRGKNSGLGLSISREIVSAHGGEIWAENRVGGEGSDKGKILGARFVVRLPGAVQGSRGGTTLGRRA